MESASSCCATWPSRASGFFEAGNFYPDFILWCLKSDGSQRICFIDPHGLEHEGPGSDKIQLSQNIKDLQARLNDPGVTLESVILSPSTNRMRIQHLWSRQSLPTPRSECAACFLYRGTGLHRQGDDQGSCCRNFLQNPGVFGAVYPALKTTLLSQPACGVVICRRSAVASTAHGIVQCKHSNHVRLPRETPLSTTNQRQKCHVCLCADVVTCAISPARTWQC